MRNLPVLTILIALLIISASCRKENTRATASVPDHGQMWDHKAQPALR